MNDFLIPANFEDSGKIMGFFSTRNVVEAAVLTLPFAFLIFKLFPLGLTWKLDIFPKKQTVDDDYYENSTQRWRQYTS